MKKRRFLLPDYEAENVYSLPFEKLWEMGIRYLFFDIDYTLVPYNAPADEKALRLFAKLRDMGFAFCFVSNNGRERVDLFNEKIGAESVVKAKKPLTSGMRKALGLVHARPEETVMIGDQLFTDILGANMAKIQTVLVGRVDRPRELQLILKCVPEKLILLGYHRLTHGRRRTL